MRIPTKKHTTNDEKMYLKSIGLHHEKARNSFTRKEMLENYIDAMPLRINWGAINQVEILKFAQQEFLNCN